MLQFVKVSKLQRVRAMAGVYFESKDVSIEEARPSWNISVVSPSCGASFSERKHIPWVTVPAASGILHHVEIGVVCNSVVTYFIRIQHPVTICAFVFIVDIGKSQECFKLQDSNKKTKSPK